MNFDRLKAALAPYDFQTLDALHTIGGPGNYLVLFSTTGDYRCACLDKNYRVMWENGLATTHIENAPFPGGTMTDHEYVIFDPALPAPRKGPIAQMAAEPLKEARELPEAIRLGQEAIDTMEAALRGETGLSIGLDAFKALAEPHGYTFKQNGHGDRLYIWKGGQYNCHLPIFKWHGSMHVDADIAREWFEGEKIVLLPKSSV